MKPTENRRKVYLGSTCAEYFREMVGSAARNQHAEVSDEVEFYLVNLLKECLRAEKVFPRNKAEDEEPLTWKLNRALNAHTFEKIRCFKELGDFTLFIAGFFPDSLSRKLVNAGFYGTIGRIAYGNLAVIMKARTNGALFTELYAELSEKFTPLADILSEVSERTSIGSNESILGIYEKWIKTNSRWDADRLKRKGILPTRGVRSSYLH